MPLKGQNKIPCHNLNDHDDEVESALMLAVNSTILNDISAWKLDHFNWFRFCNSAAEKWSSAWTLWSLSQLIAFTQSSPLPSKKPIVTTYPEVEVADMHGTENPDSTPMIMSPIPEIKACCSSQLLNQIIYQRNRKWQQNECSAGYELFITMMSKCGHESNAGGII